MATMTKSWANYASYSWKYGVAFYIDAYYSGQSIAKNQTTVYTRLTSTATSPNGTGGSGYKFQCTYCTEKSGSGVWWFDNETILSSPATAVTHNNDGSKTVTLSAYVYNSYHGINKTFSADVTLPKIPRQANIKTAVDFTDEGNPTITYENPAGTAATSLQACISWTGGADIAYRDISKTGTSYTFNFTEAERTALRNSCTTGNSRTVTFYVTTVIGGTTYYSTLNKTLTIVNANPTASLTLQETNTTVSDKLGSTAATEIVRGVSNIKATLSVSWKKGATQKSISISNGGTTGSTTPYTFNGAGGEVFSYSAVDSRGNSVSGQKTVTVIPYFSPRIVSSEFKRISLDNETVSLMATIDAYTDKLGSAGDNNFTITYTADNGKTGTITNYSASNGKILIDTTFDDLVSAGETPVITLSVTDAFGSDSASNRVGLMSPTFDIGANDVQVNGHLNVTKQTKLQGPIVRESAANNSQATALMMPYVEYLGGSLTTGMLGIRIGRSTQAHNTMLTVKGHIFQYGYSTDFEASVYYYSGNPLYAPISHITNERGFNKAHWAVDSSGYVWLLLGNTSTQWRYTGLYIEHALLTYSSGTSEEFRDGWTYGFFSNWNSFSSHVECSPRGESRPVGSIYISYTATSPADLFGGSWEKIATDRVLMGANVDSKLATTVNSGLPNITGAITNLQWNKPVGFYNMTTTGAFYNYNTWPSGRFLCEDTYHSSGSGNSSCLGFSANSSNSIYGASSIVQPPAYYVYIWRRTA